MTWVPVEACTLPTAEQPLRVAEFDEVIAGSLRHIERYGPQRASLMLSGDPALTQRVQRLIDKETACCSFFSFTMTEQGSAGPAQEQVVTLTIEVPAARADVLEALMVRAERTLPAGQPPPHG